MERIRAFYNSARRLVFYLRHEEYVVGNAIVADHKGKTFIPALGFMEAKWKGNEPEPEFKNVKLLAGGAHTLGPKASLVALLPHADGPGGGDADLQRKAPTAPAAAC